jgi:hypothetical protein
MPQLRPIRREARAYDREGARDYYRDRGRYPDNYVDRCGDRHYYDEN